MDSPFEQVLINLNDIASDVDTLVAPITRLDTAVTDITDVVTDVKNLLNDFNEVTIIIDDVRVAALALNAVPILGEVVDVLEAVSTVLDEVDAAIKPVSVIVDDVDDILIKVQEGLTDLKNILVTIANDIPDATKTLAILNAILVVGSGLVKILEGTETANKLANVVDKYNAIKQTVASDALPIVNAIEDIANVIPEFVDEINKISTTVKGVIGDAQHSVSHAHGLMIPVKDAVTVFHDALKPVLWVFGKIESLFKHIIDPIIHDVLKDTGIETLIDDLESKLEKALGISHIINDIETALGSKKIKKYGALFDSKNSVSSTATVINDWIELAEVLEEYKHASSKNKPKLITQAINDLITAIIGTAVDINKISFGGSLGPPPPPPEQHAGEAQTPKTTSITSVTQSTFGKGSKKLNAAINDLKTIQQIALSVEGVSS